MKIIVPILLLSIMFSCQRAVSFENKKIKDSQPDTLIIDNPGQDVANYIIPVSSGGYLVAGYLAGQEPNHFQGALIRLDTNNDTIWIKKYGEKGDNRAWSVCETSDGEFMVTGFSNRFSNFLTDDVWVFRTDKNGKLLWEKKFGGEGDDLSWDIKNTYDGNFVIAAQTNSKGNGNFDAWILKLNGKGDIIWDEVYGTKGRERVFSIDQGTKGEIYATGIHTPGPARQAIDVYTICVSSKNGALIWEDILDKGGDDTGHGLTSDQKGGVWVSGYTTSTGSGGQDGFLVRYLDGKISSFNTFGKYGNDRVMNVVQTNDDNLWLIGYSDSDNRKDDYNIWLTKTNRSGEELISLSIGNQAFDRAVHLLAEDRSIIVVGSYTSKAKIFEEPDIIVLRLQDSKK
jgi:hypothetical protein